MKLLLQGNYIFEPGQYKIFKDIKLDTDFNTFICPFIKFIYLNIICEYHK